MIHHWISTATVSSSLALRYLAHTKLRPYYRTISPKFYMLTFRDFSRATDSMLPQVLRE